MWNFIGFIVGILGSGLSVDYYELSAFPAVLYREKYRGLSVPFCVTYDGLMVRLGDNRGRFLGCTFSGLMKIFLLAIND